MALRLLVDDMIAASLQQVAAWKQIARVEMDDLDDLTNFFDRDRMMATLNPIAKMGYPDAIDYAILFMVAKTAQTFLFDTEQIRLFLRAIDKKIPPRTVQPPFASMVIQFTEPLPEEEMTSGTYTWASEIEMGEKRSTGDYITGLVIGFPEAGSALKVAQNGTVLKVKSGEYRVGGEDADDFANVFLFYKSGALNRAAFRLDGDGSHTANYTEGSATDEADKDKQRICNLAMLIISYLNSPGIETEKIEAPAAIQKRRQKDRKPPIEPYYVCKVQKRHYVASGAAGEPSGRHVSFRFDVSGHFRHYKDGRAVWIKSHQRGLEHERYVPKVYRIDKEEE
jgi:hypothetical protein